VGKAPSRLIRMIRRCPDCKTYTLREICRKCNKKTINPNPPKFSLEKETKYGKYRRKAKL
jgi:H/ACA ribonucleoprotein complex subunit 3